MDKVTNLTEILTAIKIVKESKKGYITNFYPEADKINVWIENGQFLKKAIGNTVFFFKEESEFLRLFYCSPSIDDLDNSLSLLKSLVEIDHLVADIIGKEPGIQFILNILKKNGFFEYTILKRMNRISDKDKLMDSNSSLKYADTTYSNSIYDLLHLYFDPIAEQLPTIEDINAWIKLNHLIIVEEKKEILGFVIFDIIGVTSYLRYWFVHSKHRNRKIGSMLLNQYFENSIGTKRQLFWVIQSNANAITRYLHYGFRSENLFDIIMTNKNSQYETTNN